MAFHCPGILMERVHTQRPVEQLFLGLHCVQYSGRPPGPQIRTQMVSLAGAKCVRSVDYFNAIICRVWLAVCVRSSSRSRPGAGLYLPRRPYNARAMGSSVWTWISVYIHIFRHAIGNGADAGRKWSDCIVVHGMAGHILHIRWISGSVGGFVGVVGMQFTTDVTCHISGGKGFLGNCRGMLYNRG